MHFVASRDESCLPVTAIPHHDTECTEGDRASSRLHRWQERDGTAAGIRMQHTEDYQPERGQRTPTGRRNCTLKYE